MRALHSYVFSNKILVPELTIGSEKLRIHPGPTMPSLYRKLLLVHLEYPCPSCLPQVSMSAGRGVKQHQVIKICLVWYPRADMWCKVLSVPKKPEEYGLHSLGDIPTALHLSPRNFSHSKTHSSLQLLTRL